MEKKRSGWRTAGLIAGIGCLSMIVIVVGGLVVATIWARATLRNIGDSDPRAVVRRITIPEAEPGAKGKPASAAGDRTAALRLTLDLQEGNFTIKPGDPGAEIRI